MWTAGSFHNLNGAPVQLETFEPNQTPGASDHSQGFVGSRKRHGFENAHFCLTYAATSGRPKLDLKPFHFAALEGTTNDDRDLVYSWVNNQNVVKSQIRVSNSDAVVDDAAYVIYGTLRYLNLLGWRAEPKSKDKMAEAITNIKDLRPGRKSALLGALGLSGLS